MDTTTIRIQRPTDDERALIHLLAHDERLRILIAAAREKAQQMAQGGAVTPPPTLGRPRKDRETRT